MQRQVSGTLIRMHGPFTLHLWDRCTATLGLLFVLLGAMLFVLDEVAPSLVSVAGGVALLIFWASERRSHEVAVWTMAADDEDPVQALVLYDYLYRLPFRDLLVVADYRERREAAGLPPTDPDDPDAPPEVRAVWEYLRAHPREK